MYTLHYRSCQVHLWSKHRYTEVRSIFLPPPLSYLLVFPAFEVYFITSDEYSLLPQVKYAEDSSAEEDTFEESLYAMVSPYLGAKIDRGSPFSESLGTSRAHTGSLHISR